MHQSAEVQEAAKEVLILGEIRGAEKKAEEIIESAKRQKESIIQDARASALKMLESAEAEISKSQERKLAGFREKSKLLFEEKMSEHKISARQTKARVEKNIGKTIDFALKKFEEMLLK